MIIVTGGAGFIGSNLVRGLNERGITDILVVDNLGNAKKVQNLSHLKIADYMDKQDFFDAIGRALESDKPLPGVLSGLPDQVTTVFHQGACSDTMASDGKYVMQNNFTFSKRLHHYCKLKGARYIYASSASVYGAGSVFRESPEFESALNVYAWSKLLFDDYLRGQSDQGISCAGLRFFNVYGPREQHKGRMASVGWHFRNQYHEHRRVRLFEGSDGYGDGEQRRDFVSVEDVVKINIFMMDHPGISGIFNVGTGQCQSFNDLALSVINALRAREDKDAVDLHRAIHEGLIEYIPMPVQLHGKYQSYTEADLGNLRSAGYSDRFLTVEEGITRYMQELEHDPHLRH